MFAQIKTWANIERIFLNFTNFQAIKNNETLAISSVHPHPFSIPTTSR